MARQRVLTFVMCYNPVGKNLGAQAFYHRSECILQTFHVDAADIANKKHQCFFAPHTLKLAPFGAPNPAAQEFHT